MSNATKADRERWSWFQTIGCIACVLEGELRGEARRGEPSDVHHEVKGYRTGHDRTAPLCCFHHRGVPKNGMTDREMMELFGPSLALHPRQFRDRYGSDAFLIDRANREIELLQEMRIN